MSVAQSTNPALERLVDTSPSPIILAAIRRREKRQTEYEAQNRTDPTRTATDRKRFASRLRGRWNAIKSHIWKGIVKNDALGLGGLDSGVDIDMLAAEQPAYIGQVDKDDSLTPGSGQFNFPSNAESAEAFGEWLDDAIEREIIQQYDGDRVISKAYSKGIKHADVEMRRQGVDVPDEPIGGVLNLPVHRDKLELLHSRAFEELKGVGNATAQAMRRELTDGLAQGLNVKEIGRNLNDRVDKIGKTRSEVIAHTEIVRTHAESSLTRYETIVGDVGVEIVAEWSTAGDDRVCERCEKLQGRTFSIEKARGMLPRHPRCRCAWKPKLPNT